MMQTVTTQPDRLRNPLVIVQVVLIGLLVVSLTLGAVLERDDRADADRDGDLDGHCGRDDRDGGGHRHGRSRDTDS